MLGLGKAENWFIYHLEQVTEKCTTLGTYCISAYYANAHAWKLATPCVVAALYNIACGLPGGGRGGWVTNLYACALFIIDGLGHATWSLKMPVSRSRIISFSKITTLFLSACYARAAGIAHEPVLCL